MVGEAEEAPAGGEVEAEVAVAVAVAYVTAWVFLP